MSSSATARRWTLRASRWSLDACERIHVLDGLTPKPLAGMADRHVIVGGQRYRGHQDQTRASTTAPAGFADFSSRSAHATSLYDYVTRDPRRAAAARS